MTLLLFYLLISVISYTLFTDLVNARKDHVAAMFLALVWPLWIPLVLLFLSIAILYKKE